MRRFRFFAAPFVLCAALPACTDPGEAERVDSARAAVTGPREAYYVVLAGPSAVRSIPKGVDPRSEHAARVTRARVAQIDAEQAALEPVLEALGGEVVARLSRLVNAIQVLADEEAARRMDELPGVVRVERVPLVERALATSVPLVSAPSVWAKTPGLAGEGITIGIIDSGIDYTHADFGGPGTAEAYAANDPKVIEPGSFPTAKVVGGWDFAGDAYDPSGGSPNPKPDPDPLDCTTPGGEDISGGHGTHVAGIAAGIGVTADGQTYDGTYEASFAPGTFRVAPGVAPRAQLFALKIFGCEGSSSLLGAALDRAADPNNDGAVDDRLDVVNASLGTSYALGSPSTGEMVSALTAIGTLVVAAAGNDRQNFFVTASPASLPEVLSVAASEDNPFATLSVVAPEGAGAVYPAAEGAFTASLHAVGVIQSEVVAASPLLGCSELANAADVAGKIVLMRRGSCQFVEKLGNAVAAGAIAAVVVDNENALLPFSMGGDGAAPVPIPGVMVTKAHGEEIEAAIADGPVTIALDPARYTGPGNEVLGGFSARGPSAVDGRLKPEIAAPGAIIESAGVGSGTEPRSSQGTSMASPLVAGAAALVRQARPEWSPFEVKAALVNGAAPLLGYSSLPYVTSQVGGGRVDVARSAAATLTAAANAATGEVGVSFGAVIADEPVTVKRTFVVTNHGGEDASLSATVLPTHELPGVAVSVSPAVVDVAAGQTAQVELTLSLDPAALGDPGPDPGTPATQGGQEPTPRHWLNEASGVVRLSRAGGGTEQMLVPYHGSVRAAADLSAKAPAACAVVSAAPGDAVEIPLEGASAHPEPVITAFQLLAVDEKKLGSDTDAVTASTDIRAVGVATDLATAPSFDEAFVHFGVAVTGDWTTPARGPVSLVSIEIDADQDGSPGRTIRVEARNPERPFRDSLVARTYDLDTGESFERQPINILTPDVARTHPFNNSVLVLSALLSDLGLDPEHTAFDWTVRTERPDLIFQSERVDGTFDVAKPLVDTARHGTDGAPVFLGTGPVLVDVSAEARAAGAPVDVLLLHHTNVAERRWEVVRLETSVAANVALAIEAPPGMAADQIATASLVVANTGTEPVPGATVAASLTGGELLGAAADQGTCTAGAALDCQLGDIAPGASVRITATLRATLGSASVAIDATASSELACEASANDNAQQAAIPVQTTSAPVTPPPLASDVPREQLVAAGGCGCRAAGAPDAERAGWLAVGAGWLAWSRSRRRAARAKRA